MPKKDKHFHVFQVLSGDLEEKLNSLYEEGFSVVQVLALGQEEHVEKSEKCPLTGYSDFEVHQLLQIVCIQMPQIPDFTPKKG